MLKSLSLIALTAILASCGGPSYYLHKNVPATTGKSLSPVTLNAGETVKALKHSSGLMWGGYKQGIAIEDPEIASIRYGKDGHDRWAPKAYLIGLKPGTTRVVYCNRLGERPNFSKGLDADFQCNSFEIIVH